MKKLLIIITLFVSSFFLFCNKEVKAYEYIKEVDFSLMDTVLSLKEKLDAFIETDTEYSDYYFIYYVNNEIRYYTPRYSFSLDDYSFTFSNSYFRFYLNTNHYYGTNLNEISFDKILNGGYFYFYSAEATYSTDYLLYSNFDFSFTSSKESNFTYFYNDFSYVKSYVSGEKILSSYDLYLKYKEEVGETINKHTEELGKVESFYTVVIEKLSYLAEEIVSNYIYLSIIVIFILIFVFLLIFRRFL